MVQAIVRNKIFVCNTFFYGDSKMRHRKKGRKLGRNPKHQRALLRSLATALILTERDPSLYEGNLPHEPKAPAIPGRIVTTIHKAKEVRPFVERCITIAKKGVAHRDAAEELEPEAERGSQEWQQWRNSEQYYEWNQAMAPALAARRRLIQLLGNKEAVSLLFDEIAPRFEDRDGGYTRVLRLATRRLGDAGVQAILEFVGKNDRVKIETTRPTFSDEETETEEVVDEQVEEDAETEDVEAAAEETEAEESTDEEEEK